MIIHALYDLYQRLIDDPNSGISPPGYSRAKVSYALNLSPDGELLDLIDLFSQGEKQNFIEMDVPRQVKRTVGVEANFLCDSAGYILGVDAKGNPERTQRTFQAFVDLHTRLLTDLDDPGAQAVVAFARLWRPEQAADHPVIGQALEQLLGGGSLVFRLDGELGYIHQRPAIRALWERHQSDSASTYRSQCLVTGEMLPVARLHDSIKGVVGAQSSGAALVSFNLDAFTSYGKSQNFNAPISERVAYGYVTALNHLLSDDRHRLRMADTTIVFWAERQAQWEEDLIAELLDPAFDTAQSRAGRDPATTQQIRDLMQRIKQGMPIKEVMTQVDPEVRFYILGLAPNAARLAVRFWQVDTFGGLVERIGQHYRDLELVPTWESDPENIPPWMLLKETAPLGDSKRIPPSLSGGLMRSILSGAAYPQSLYITMLSRIRADMKVNYMRCSMIKACLLREARLQGNDDKEELVTVSLNEQSSDTGYLLGRLFALIEKAQQDANPGINATIRDRYFASASATPGSVFPVLLRLAQHHIAKSDYGSSLDRRIQEVVDSLNGFPSYLNLEQQGQFILGYYHQRQALYQKKEK